MRYDAIVLAGGSSRRMGGGDKTTLTVDGMPLLDRVLTALPDAFVRVVVGAHRPTLLPVAWAREDPPGGGPVAAVAAGLPLVQSDFVVLLAGDLPFVDGATVAALLAAASDSRADPDGAADRDGAVAVDDLGAPQWLCSAWRTEALRRLLASQQVEGMALRRVFASASYRMIPLADGGQGAVGPWFDCDTPDDLARAKEHR
ncbi:MAG: molybdenum cofactor guanylyltransferase [Frankiales bacterium]|nr:molybdenum cofactor guanylyltransferase [Frankiales bacterium]